MGVVARATQFLCIARFAALISLAMTQRDGRRHPVRRDAASFHSRQQARFPSFERGPQPCPVRGVAPSDWALARFQPKKVGSAVDLLMLGLRSADFLERLHADVRVRASHERYFFWYPDDLASVKLVARL